MPSKSDYLSPEDWQDGPFGNPDAMRINIDDFINIDGVVIRPHKNKRAMSDRIIIGRKGSGKTLYIRMLQDAARDRDFFVHGEVHQLSTNTVMDIHRAGQLYTNTRLTRDKDISLVLDARQTLVSFWRLVWDRAFLISLSTLFYSETVLKAEHVNPSVLEAIRRVRDGRRISQESFHSRFYELVPDSMTYYSPANALRHIGDRLAGPKGFRYLEDVKWEEIRNIIVECTRLSPPIGIYIDSIDDEYEAAPEPWLLCQSGLFRSVFELMYPADHMANRIHIVVALRDIVYSALLKSEHGLRFVHDEHIRVLDWSNVHIRMFLFEKLKRLRKKGTLKFPEDTADPVSAWLGFSQIQNAVRNTEEDITDYLIRHCRMLPRDVVVLGNVIAAEMKKRVGIAGKHFGQNSLRKAVAEVSRMFGRESITICINELMSSFDYFYELTRDHINSETVTLGELRRVFDGRVKSFFDRIRCETFDFSDLKSSLIDSGLARNQDFYPHAESYYRFDNILWRHGLLAYQEREGVKLRWKYNWRVKADGDQVPSFGNRLGIHPCLIDRFNLQVCSDGPVF